MKFLRLIFLGLILPPLNAHSQELHEVLDSISSFESEKQSRILDDMAWELRNTAPYEAETFALEALQIVKETNNQHLQAVYANTIGVINRKKPDFDRSLAYYDTALLYHQSTGNIKQQAVIHNNKANVWLAAGHADSAQSHAETSLSFAREINDSIRITGVLTSLGNIAKDKGLYEKAFNYYKECLAIDIALEDSTYSSVDLSNMADVMLYSGQYERSFRYYMESLQLIEGKGEVLSESITYSNLGALMQKQKLYDSALSYFNIHLKLSEAISDSSGISFAYNQIAQIYYLKGHLDRSLTTYKKALVTSTNIKDPSEQGSAHHGLGKVLLSVEDFSQSIFHLNKAVETAKRVQNVTLLIESFQSLSHAYQMAGNDRLAYEYLSSYVQLNDSVNNISILSKVADLETKYDTERKEQEIKFLSAQTELQAATIERNQLIIALVAVTAFFGIAVIWVLFRQRNYKLKAQFEEEKSNLKSKQIAAVIDTQETERSRFAMDLHDSFGQLISALRLITSQVEETKASTNDLLDKMYASLKNIAFNLMPATLVQKDIIASVEELCDQISQSGMLQMTSTSFVQKLPFGKPDEIVIYRIIQELTNNITKYANATSIEIDLTQQKSTLQIMITDDGNGYDPDKFYLSSNNGWKNVSSRLDILRGEIEIDSRLNRKGSTIIIQIPLENVKQAA